MKKILFCAEFSGLNSGFGNYSKNVLGRLHSTGKYEIAELSNYCSLDDPKIHQIPWKVYANAPNKQNDPRRQQYDSNEANQFGYWRFDRTLLDFKPDVVVSLLDTQMSTHHVLSPLRDFYNLTWFAPVDSNPLKIEWIEDLVDCDGVMTYTEYGQRVLQKEGGSHINTVGVAGGGVEHNIFKPYINKKECRRKLGVLPDVNIIGMVARNQERKLFPDLFKGFRLFLDIVENTKKELARKTYLLLHTSSPDLGWSIPELLLEYGLSSKVLFPYICKNCGHYFVQFWSDCLTLCHKCGKVSAILPNVIHGYTQHQQNDIYNLMDLYVQYANAEGFGLPIVEAAACGVPTAVINYSAMEDFVKTLSSYPIKVKTFTKHVQLDAERACPDNEDFVKLLRSFFIKPESQRRLEGFKSRESSKLYSWDNVAKVWESYLDNLQLKDKQGKWDLPPEIMEPNLNVPPNLSNLEFYKWIISNVWRKPEKVNSKFGLELYRGLVYGAVRGKKLMTPFTRENAIQKLVQLRHNINKAEQYRTGKVELNWEDYLEYANRARN